MDVVVVPTGELLSCWRVEVIKDSLSEVLVQGHHTLSGMHDHFAAERVRGRLGGYNLQPPVARRVFVMGMGS